MYFGIIVPVTGEPIKKRLSNKMKIVFLLW